MTSRFKWIWVIGLCAAGSGVFAQTLPSFSEAELGHISQFWKEHGRYQEEAPSTLSSKGPWRVRLNPKASLWLHAYNSARGIGKGAAPKPGQPAAGEARAWNDWLSRRIAYDWYQAGLGAAEANSRYLGTDVPCETPSADDPGPMPDAMRAFAGEAPVFASAVTPMTYRISYPDGVTIELTDNPKMKPNYPSYRFPQGVMSGGTPLKSMPKEELDSLFADAGIAESAQRVMTAVSGMEGGFDSVNTYDTGYVSVGLIQFACLSKGAGSLSQVLLREKNEDAGSFQTDFRQYGISVSESGALLAADLDGSTVSEGPAAARKIVEDKRLISVFKHAGQTSRAFRIAQLRVAKDMYYPAEDLVTVDIGGQSLTGKVGDFIRSEAGMATIMDRKVVTGKIDALGAALTRLGAECQCQSVDDFADHELEIMAAVRYRHDFAQDLDLSQPGVGAARDGSLTSRHGGRTGRQGGRRSTGSK